MFSRTSPPLKIPTLHLQSTPRSTQILRTSRSYNLWIKRPSAPVLCQREHEIINRYRTAPADRQPPNPRDARIIQGPDSPQSGRERPQIFGLTIKGQFGKASQGYVQRFNACLIVARKAVY